MDAHILAAHESGVSRVDIATMLAGRSSKAVRIRLRKYMNLLNSNPQEADQPYVKRYPHMDNASIKASEEGQSAAQIKNDIFRPFPTVTVVAIGKRLDYLKNLEVAKALGLSSVIGFDWPGEDDESLIIPDEPTANREENWAVDLGRSSSLSILSQATAIKEDYVCDLRCWTKD